MSYVGFYVYHVCQRPCQCRYYVFSMDCHVFLLRLDAGASPTRVVRESSKSEKKYSTPLQPYTQAEALESACATLAVRQLSGLPITRSDHVLGLPKVALGPNLSAGMLRSRSGYATGQRCTLKWSLSRNHMKWPYSYNRSAIFRP